VNYQEYHLVYGEQVEAALLFLFHAIAPKDDPAFPFQGIPAVLYMDNGPLAKPCVFRRVLAKKLGIEIKIHETPQPGGQRRTSARAKGKVERCFRTAAGERQSGIGAWRRWSTWPRGYPSSAP
jgi:hypothetical protein